MAAREEKRMTMGKGLTASTGIVEEEVDAVVGVSLSL